MPKEQAEAIAELRELLKPGDTVYCIVRHTTRALMNSISPVIIRDGKPWEITHLVRPALGWKFDHKHGGVKVSGYQSNARSALVNAIGRKLYPDADPPALYGRDL